MDFEHPPSVIDHISDNLWRKHVWIALCTTYLVQWVSRQVSRSASITSTIQIVWLQRLAMLKLQNSWITAGPPLSIYQTILTSPYHCLQGQVTVRMFLRNTKKCHNYSFLAHKLHLRWQTRLKQCITNRPIQWSPVHNCSVFTLEALDM